MPLYSPPAVGPADPLQPWPGVTRVAGAEPDKLAEPPRPMPAPPGAPAPAPAPAPASVGSPSAIGTEAQAGPSGFYAAYAATYFKPRFTGQANGAPTTPSTLTVPTIFGTVTVPLSTTGATSPEYQYEGDSRYWLGYEAASGVGARGRYSHYHSDSNTVVATASGSGTGFVGSSVPGTASSALTTFLNMRVLDLDATYDLVGANWALLGAVGVRYARLTRDADQSLSSKGTATIVGTNLGTTTQSSVSAVHQSFEQWGPTFALEGRRRLLLGPLTGAWFVNLRTSELEGDAHLNSTASSTSTLSSFAGATTSTAGSSTTFSRPVQMWVWEVEVGTELGRLTRYGEFFLRASLEGQHWSEAGSAIGASPHGDNLNMTGVTIGGGWRR